jgi:hypothetical protein
MKEITLFILVLLFAFALPVYAAHDATISANWAWNGTDPTTAGFRFYLDGVVVQDIPDATARTSEFVVPMENGKHIFSMTAYGPDWETEHSPDYPFEYMFVDQNNRPSPTVFIMIN